jgi:hypothetical protein
MIYMETQIPTNMDSKVNLSVTVDSSVVRAINEQRKREKRSTYVNYLLRNALGIENTEGTTA